jgi:hypothetical protein
LQIKYDILDLQDLNGLDGARSGRLTELDAITKEFDHRLAGVVTVVLVKQQIHSFCDPGI